MKTESYNPSILEVELATVLTKLQEELEKGLSSNKIIQMSANLNLDNPTVEIKTEDVDGDPHEIVIKVIQRPDKF